MKTTFLCVFGLLLATGYSQPLVVDMEINGMIHDPVRDVLYGSMNDDHPTTPNSIVKLDPKTLNVLDVLPVGPNPGPMAISESAQTLYVGFLQGAPGVAQIDLQKWEIVRFFDLGTNPFFPRPLIAEDIEVQPGTEDVVAVARGDYKDSGFYGVVIVDAGIMRPISTDPQIRANDLEFDEDPSRLYGLNTTTSLEEFSRMTVGIQGVSINDYFPAALGISDWMRYSEGKLFATSGRVIDPVTMATLGTYPMHGFLTIDEDAGKAFFLRSIGGSHAIRAGSLSTYGLLESRIVPNLSGHDLYFARWGESGFVYMTFQGRVCTLESSLAWDNVNVPPAVVNLNRGVVVSGGSSSLAFFDNQRLVVRPGITFTTQQTPIEIDLVASAPSASVDSLNFTIESHGSATNVRQVIYLYNYEESSFVQIDSRNLSTVDTALYFDRIGNAAPYIHKGSGEVRVRLTYRANGPVFSYPWEARLDVARWSFPQ